MSQRPLSLWGESKATPVLARLLPTTVRQAIVLLHDAKYDDPGEDRSQTVQALSEIICGLRFRGYRLVTLTEMAPPESIIPRKKEAV